MDIVRTHRKILFALGADEPSSSEAAKGLKEGVVSDVMRGGCWWKKRGSVVYFLCFFASEPPTQPFSFALSS